MTPITPSKGYVEAWDVESLTDCSKRYVVSKRKDGRFACSCPAWKFASAPKPDCKHIRALRDDVVVASVVKLVKVFFDGALVAQLTQAQADNFRATLAGTKRPETKNLGTPEFRITRKFRLDE